MVKFPDTIHNIKVECVQVPEGHRPVDEATLALLVTSIEEIGLQTPISVQIRDAVTLSKGNKADSWVLLAGAHRLAAAKQLAWATIPAFVLSDDPARAQMWTVAENLHRKELSEIEQSDHVALWLHLHNAKVARDAPPSGGVQPTDAGVRRTARALGLDRRKVQRLLVVAGIAEEAKVEAKVLGLDDDQSALLKIAQCEPPGAS